jgi:hypothetical protein
MDDLTPEQLDIINTSCGHKGFTIICQSCGNVGVKLSGFFNAENGEAQAILWCQNPDCEQPNAVYYFGAEDPSAKW